MRLRICRQPTGTIDGIELDQFRAGQVYDIATPLASVFIAEGWGEPFSGEEATNAFDPEQLLSAVERAFRH